SPAATPEEAPDPEREDDPDGARSPEQETLPGVALASAESAPTPPDRAPETIRLRGLGLRGSQGWAFRDVDLTAAAGDLVVLAGPSGSGRSALLLAIAGRLRASTGDLEVVGAAVGEGTTGRRALRQI